MIYKNRKLTTRNWDSIRCTENKKYYVYTKIKNNIFVYHIKASVHRLSQKHQLRKYY